jgi:hypothetical protein
MSTSYEPTTQRTTNTLAVVSMIFGIASWVVLPFVGAIVAVVCGHLARREIRQALPGSTEGDGMAVAGLVLGYVHLALALACVMFVFAFVVFGFGLGAGLMHGIIHG